MSEHIVTKYYKNNFYVLQLVHEVITEDTPCSSCAKNQTSDHSSCAPGNTEPILQRLTNLVDLVKQSKAGYIEGKVHVLTELKSIYMLKFGVRFDNQDRSELANKN